MEERAELLGRPDLPFGRQALRRVNRVGDVASDITLAHGVLEGAMEDRVDVLDGLGRHPLAVPEPAADEERLIEGVELAGESCWSGIGPSAGSTQVRIWVR